MSYQTILFEKKAGYAIITINRPEKMNALNELVFAELHDCLTFAQKEDDVQALIITGSGAKAFAAGADIAELHKQDGSTGTEFSSRGQAVFNLIEYFGRPVIAAVNGFALGGGCELALACHLRFASENAKFGQPEVTLGILPGYGGTQRLTKLIGRAKSIELILSGAIITASEAERIGLVNSVHASESLIEYAEEFVRIILSKGQLAVRAALEAILAVDELLNLKGLELEAQKFGELCGTADFKEGTKAFLEKRPAEFSNR